MPFIEITTSKQDIHFEISGILTMTRRFKVWGAAPETIYRDPASIPCQDGSATRMPAYGDVADANVQGPNTPTSGSPLISKLTLWLYSVEAVSAIQFIATAHYSNDPKLPPMGLDYASVENFHIVEIPYVRQVTILSPGTAGTAPISFVEASIGLPMPSGKLRQTVMIPRKQRDSAENSGQNEAGNIHVIREDAYLFQGVDLQMHGAEYMTATYNWTWEGGIDVDIASIPKYVQVGNLPDGSQDVNAIYPLGSRPLNAAVGDQNTPLLLPPYHTIELMYSQIVPQLGGQQPSWVWRLPYPVSPTGWTGLVGSSGFEWVINP